MEGEGSRCFAVATKRLRLTQLAVAVFPVDRSRVLKTQQGGAVGFWHCGWAWRAHRGSWVLFPRTLSHPPARQNKT